jgi:RNA polymerase sigma-70 factor (family 1)
LHFETVNPLQNNTDEELLAFVKQNDERAFAELFNRYWKKAHTLASSKLPSLELTREIVQELFCNLWERRHSLDITNFEHYLKVSVKYKAINYIKSEITHHKYSDYYKAFAKIHDEETLKSVNYHELQEALEKGVQKLPEKTQKVFRLNRLEGKPITEVANALHLSEKAIQYHLARSLKELRVYLKDFLVSVILMLNF